ncbi:MAG: hypothetical protein M3492_10345, partial [Actinomycetota bacterium]|nr:hypothetical protein [Actinomycetota bacterium]
RALAHVSRHPCRYRVEEGPALVQKRDLAVDLGVIHRFVLETRGGEGRDLVIGADRSGRLLEVVILNDDPN